MPRSPLTPRQREVRKLIIESRGLIRTSEIAQQLNVGRVTIWRDVKAIQRERPIPVEAYAEETEIKAAVDWFEQAEEVLIGELEENELEITARKGSTDQTVIGFLNVRCNLLNQLRQAKKDRLDFLLKIGYIREAPKRLSLETPLSEMSKSDLDREISVLDDRIRELEGGGDGQGIASGDEAETLPLPAQTDD